MRDAVAIRPPTLPISGSHLPSWQDATTSSPTFWRHCGPGRAIRSLCRHCSGTGASARPVCWTRSGTGPQAARVVGGNRQAAPRSDLVADLATSFARPLVLARSWARRPPARGERVADFTNGAPFSGTTLRSHPSENQGEGTLIGRVGRSDGSVCTLVWSRGILIGIEDTMLARPAELAALARTVRAEVEGSHLPVALIFSGLPSFTTAIGRKQLAGGGGVDEPSLNGLGAERRRIRPPHKGGVRVRTREWRAAWKWSRRSGDAWMTEPSPATTGGRAKAEAAALPMPRPGIRLLYALWARSSRLSGRACGPKRGSWSACWPVGGARNLCKWSTSRPR